MKVLYLSAISINAANIGSHIYNGCGWIGALIKSITEKTDIQVGVSFFSRNAINQKVNIDEVTFYINREPSSSRFDVITSLLSDRDEYDNKKLSAIEKVVADFNPDIIQVFGSEDCLGLITERTTIPVIIHLQGVINSCLNAFLPPTLCWRDYPNIALNSKHKLLRYFDKRNWSYNAKREIDIFRSCKYFVGRTEWDKSVTAILSENAEYFHCWEIMREVFYDNSSVRQLPKKLVLTSTISNVSYKGYDVILKTARILKDCCNVDFEWHIFGGVNNRFFERQFGVKASENIILRGVAAPDEIKNQILNSTAFVHLSYIDNSSNSVSEAMILGCPVIVTYVGGLTSMIENSKTGILVPANDPIATAYSIINLYQDSDLNIHIGDNAKAVALKRHNIDAIVNTMYNIYNQIIRNENHTAF